MEAGEEQITENIQGRGKSIIIWPILSQIYGVILVLVVRPVPKLELSVKESAGLSLIYVAFMLVITYFFLYLIRKGLANFLKMIFLVSLFMSSTLSLSLVFLDLKYGSLLSFLASVVLMWLWRKPGIIGNIAKAIFAAASSHIIVSAFPDTFVIFFLALLAVYDAYSVFKGPLGKMFDSLEFKIEVLRPLFVTHKGVGLGIGDLLIYSIAASFSVRAIGLPMALLPLISLNLGIFVTLDLLLKRKAPLPGVTIPIGLWIPCFFLAKLIS